MLRATLHPLERGNMSKELYILSCRGGADTHLFQSRGRLLFLLGQRINIHPSFCNLPSGQEPCCSRFAFRFFGLVCFFNTLGKLFCLDIDEDMARRLFSSRSVQKLKSSIILPPF